MMIKNKKILITGADGQLGQAFTKSLEEKKIDHLSLEKNKLDITNFKKVNKIIKEYNPDFLINCAAYNNVNKAEECWKTAFLVNGIAVKNLALSSRKNNYVLVHYSTDYIFDGKKGSPYTITDIPHPLNKYGQSKLLGERYIQNLSKNYYLIRLSSVFGNNPEVCFPLKILSWSKNKKEIKIVKDQICSPSFTKDVVKATLLLIETERYGLYHLTNSGFCSRYEWAKFILEKSKWPGKVLAAKTEDFNSKTKRPKFSVLDSSPLEKIINYKLPTWQKATQEFLEEYNFKK